MSGNCFNVSSTCPLSEVTLKTVTFENPTPPSTFYNTWFSAQAIENGLKIYVPDEGFEAYYNKLTGYQGFIYPASQKD